MTPEEAAASIASPPISPLPHSRSNGINANKPFPPFDSTPTFTPARSTVIIPQDAQQSDHTTSASEVEMMASLDAVLAQKANAQGTVSQEPTSDYYSSSVGGGSDNGHDEDSDERVRAQNQDRAAAPATPTPDQDPRETATPTLAQMGLDGLSELELRMLLQNAYEVIQEKERDLGMAALMGQGLVESNSTLQAKYQHILTQLRQQRLHRPRQLTPPRTIILSQPQDVSGMVVIDPVDEANNSDNENWEDFEPARSTMHPPTSYPNSMNSSHHHVSFRRSSNHAAAMRSRSHHDIEKLATLENLNSELQAKVDSITKELKQGRRQAFKRHRKAEQELKTVKDELERTTLKVVDLEEQNGRLIEASRMIRMRRIMLKNQLPAPGSIPGSTMATIAAEMQGDDMTIQEMLAEDIRIFEELRDRLQSLERKNQALVHQKAEADKKTQQLAQDLSDVQAEHEELLTNLCGYSDLQTAYNEQCAHVRELENSIQELQNTISTMSSRLSQLNSPLMSPSEPSSPVQTLWRRDDADLVALKTVLHGASPQPMALKSPNLKGQRRPPRRTLLAELESEWFRNVSFFGPPRVVEQQQSMHLPGVHAPKSPKALKNHRHDSESEAFSDDAGGRVNGWRERIQDMDEESVCESSSCIRKRRNRFKYAESDTDGGAGGHHGEGDSDVERYQLYRRSNKRRASRSGMGDEDDMLSDCSDPHHLNHRRPSTPGCCCHLYDSYSGYSSFDEDMCDEEESVVGWAHFEDYDASSYGYDKYRDGYYHWAWPFTVDLMPS
ncbi:hypothetical protein BGZ50_000502 [Haplosporangium sp. Z 11]|nr:hypothetical protein BGZ50_000502 [Haplosporangium sp. Z 11]